MNYDQAQILVEAIFLEEDGLVQVRVSILTIRCPHAGGAGASFLQ
jgi:hypothetical protein